jgi:PQQ-dependent catabolism-associated CXXCW motif protein
VSCTVEKRRTTIARAVAAALLLVALAAAAAPPVAEPDGYRMEDFRAPVPATLKGARVLTTAEAEALWRAGDAVFIDVLPKPPKPELPEGTVWREPPHFDIPGSVWLPDVGYGALNPQMEQWYRDSLASLARGDKARRLVLYCRQDCWMSWNAAKRAVEWGYTNVTWYPGGVEAWGAAKLPLEERAAAPRPGEGE